MKSTWLLNTPRGLALLDEAGEQANRPCPLPQGAVQATFGRYAKPLDAAAEPYLATASSLAFDLDFGVAASLHHLRFMGRGSVHPADYLVLEVAGREKIAAPAPLVTGALRALALAALRTSR